MPGGGHGGCGTLVEYERISDLERQRDELLKALKSVWHQTWCDCLEPQHGGDNHEPDCWVPLARAAIASVEKPGEKK